MAGMGSSDAGAGSVSAPLVRRIHEAIAAARGWIGFDRYMAMALYAPGLGYYARGNRQFGTMPSSGSDFVTAPELTPVFGATLAVQVRQALEACGSGTVWEFGAGSGALAGQLLEALGDACTGYRIVDLSGTLRERQQQHLARHAPKVQWLDALPDSLDGVIVGNEVLDAMPVQLLHFDGTAWLERGVVRQGDGCGWGDRPTHLRPPETAIASALPGAVTERHTHAEAWVRTLAEHVGRGAAFFIDYGFPEREYHHAQRHGGTLMCHRGHRADTDPLADPGEKDITAHVDWSAIALAAQDAGWDVIGYTTQAHFLLNCGITGRLAEADVRTRAAAQVLLSEHEMGELFKVLALARGVSFDPVGFVRGDRMHTL
jgi:SAM-dependent MidA family methyltransferase